MYLIGDFNLNLLNAESHHLTSEFLETLYSYSFMPFINKPTRVQKNTASLIDNIFSNSYDNPDSLNGILYSSSSLFIIVTCAFTAATTKFTNKF